LRRKYTTKIIKTDPKKQNVEYNKSIGMHASKADLLFMIDHDNILPNKNVLARMVKPFVENEDLVGAETIHYFYNKNYFYLDRYIALFGVTDPIAYYLGRADRMSYHRKSYNEKYKPEVKKGYSLVNFTLENLPTIGANGFMIRRKILLENAKVDTQNYFHTDVNADLIKKGFNKYAFINDSIAHIGGSTSIVKFLARRGMFMKQFFLDKSKVTVKKRRYKLYTEKDIGKLILFIVISVTIIVPLIDSIRGYMKVRDIAWFLHPIMCLGFVITYGYAVIEYKMHSIFSRNTI
jgi:hypothetical protein